MRIFSWNVNGIRAVGNKGFGEWVHQTQPDFLCLQEIKAFKDQVPMAVHTPAGYQSHFFSAKKPGYSGVATYFKAPPINVIEGINVPEFDDEGRVLTVEAPDFFLVNTYFPNSQALGARLPYKLRFCNELLKFLKKLEKTKPVILCGDYNIAHKPIDLRNPKSNEKTAGYLPEERAWLDYFFTQGFIDTFRMFNQEPGQYTWWSYRFDARTKNIGWRIDYHTVSEALMPRVKCSVIHPDVLGSDHCPVEIEII